MTKVDVRDFKWVAGRVIVMDASLLSLSAYDFREVLADKEHLLICSPNGDTMIPMADIAYFAVQKRGGPFPPPLK